MTQEIYLSIAGIEHMTKQPKGRRNALFCKEALSGTWGFDCKVKNRGGHIGDYSEYPQAKEVGIDHPHSVVIKFYPDIENSVPSEVFLDDLGKLSAERKQI